MTRSADQFPSPTRTSTRLLAAIRDSSDAAAWGEMDRRYRPLLLAVGRRLGLPFADAEDAAQETLAAFLVEYRAGNYRRDTGRLRDWLAGIMAHKVRDAQRKSRRQSSLVQNLPIEDSSIHTALEREWRESTLRQCMHQLREEVSPQMYASFELFALQQWPAEQVAGRLGISVDVVYQNKRRMLMRIRQLLAAMGDE